jgi:hypothetical protein
MVMNLAIDIFAILAGFVGMLWLLVAWLEAMDEPVASLADGPPAERSPITPAADNEDAFIPIPSHLTTQAEMVDWMTRERRRPNLPVVLTTGYSQAAQVRASTEAFPLLSKPYSFDELEATLRGMYLG